MNEARLFLRLRWARGMAGLLGFARILLVTAGCVSVAGVAQGGVGLVFSESPLLIQASWILLAGACVFAVGRESRALLALIQLAAVAEKLGGQPRDQFVTASELATVAGSDEFRSRAIAQAAAAFPRDWIVRLAKGQWRRVLLLAAGGASVLVWMVWKNPRPDFRWALWPFRSALRGIVSVQPGDALYPRGDDVAVTVRVSAKDFAEPRLEVRSPGLGWESRTLLLVSPGVYTVLLRSLTEPLDYRVLYQNRRGARYRLTPFDPPKLIHVGVRVDPPAYAGKKPDLLADLLSVRVLAGSRVRWSLVLDPPDSVLRREEDARLSPLGKNGAEWSWTETVDRPMKQTLWASRSKGFGEAHLVDVSMEAVGDEPPTVVLLGPAEDVQVDVKGRLPVTAELADDVGLADVSLLWRVDPGEWKRTLWKKFPMGVVADVTENEIDLGRLSLKAGDRVEFFLAARDRCPTPHERRSDVRRIEVVDEKATHDRIVDDGEALRKSLLDRLAEQRDLRQEVSVSTPNWGGLLTGQRQVARRLSVDADRLNHLLEGMDQDPGTDGDTLLDHKGMADSLQDINQDTMPEADRSLAAQDQSRAERAMDRGIAELERLTRLSAQSVRDQKMRQLLRDQSDLSNFAENTARSLSAKSSMTEEEARKFQETVQAMREMADRIRDRIEKMQSTFTEDELKKARVETLRFDRVSKSLSRLSQALQDKNGAEALAAAKDALEQLREIERQINGASSGSSGPASEAMNALSEEQQRLDGLIQRQESLLDRTLTVVSKRNALSGEEWETVYPWADEQDALAADAGALSEKIAAVASNTALVSPRLAVQVSSAAAVMRDAAQTLRFRAVQHTQEKQERALELLRETQEKLSDAMENSRSLERSAGTRGPTMRRRRGGPNGAGATDDVKLPAADEFHPPVEFRKELMDSMKESYPPDQEGPVQNYFRHWTK